MSLRPILGILVALAILSITSVTGAGGALAHGAHGHPAAAPATPSHTLAHDERAAAAEYSPAAHEGDQALPTAGRDAPGDRSPSPCHGHCCGVAGVSCCGFTHPATGLTALCARAGAAKVIAINDRDRDGVGPCSILRPPRTLA